MRETNSHERGEGNALASRSKARNYVVEANPWGLRSFSFTFPGQSEAIAHLDFGDGGVGERPVGLDGIPRLSPGGRFGVPAALQGWWEDSSTFVFDYDEVANINCYRFRLTFVHHAVDIELKEKTGLTEVRFEGNQSVTDDGICV